MTTNVVLANSDLLFWHCRIFRVQEAFAHKRLFNKTIFTRGNYNSIKWKLKFGFYYHFIFPMNTLFLYNVSIPNENKVVVKAKFQFSFERLFISIIFDIPKACLEVWRRLIRWSLHKIGLRSILTLFYSFLSDQHLQVHIGDLLFSPQTLENKVFQGATSISTYF